MSRQLIVICDNCEEEVEVDVPFDSDINKNTLAILIEAGWSTVKEDDYCDACTKLLKEPE